MLAPPLREDVLGHGAGIPLRPRPVVHRHTRVVALVSRQGHLARRHARTAGHRERPRQVHARTGEQRLEVVLGQEVTRRRQEGMEGHAEGAWDVAGFCVCGKKRERKRESERQELEDKFSSLITVFLFYFFHTCERAWCERAW